MACFCTHLYPFTVLRASPLAYSIRSRISCTYCIHLFQGNTSLLSAAANRFIPGIVGTGTEVLTRNTCRQHWNEALLLYLHRTGNTQSIPNLMSDDTPTSSPSVYGLPADLLEFFQSINIINSVSMCHTTARETYKTRMQIGQSLCQVSS